MSQSLRVALAQLNFCVGAVAENTDKIIQASRLARGQADLIVFPELALSGYPAEDLLLRPDFLVQCVQARQTIQDAVQGIDIVLGHPSCDDDHLYNTASYLRDGELFATYHKRALPNYLVFDEKRYFHSGNQPCVVTVNGVRVGITICEDLWEGWPLRDTVEHGAQLLLNINASPYHSGKRHQREELIRDHCRELKRGIVYVNLVGGQDELVFDGGSMVVLGDASIAVRCGEFNETVAIVELQVDGDDLRISSSPASVEPLDTMAGIYQALQLGLKDYVRKSGFNSVVLGLSGGIDSALVLALAVDALGADAVTAVMMPSRYTSDISLRDAATMASTLGVDYRIIAIEPMFKAFMQNLAFDLQLDATNPQHVSAENIQARVRGIVVMAMANRFGKLVLATGNKSEMAVGYATLYGDMAGAYAPIKDVKKTLVYRLAVFRNRQSAVIPERVIERAPSAELAAGQTDQDSLPDYDVLDAIIEAYIEEDVSVEEIVASGIAEHTVNKVVRMIVVNEYKRRQSAPGVRITKRAFGKDRRYPIVNGFNLEGS